MVGFIMLSSAGQPEGPQSVIKKLEMIGQQCLNILKTCHK